MTHLQKNGTFPAIWALACLCSLRAVVCEELGPSTAVFLYIMSIFVVLEGPTDTFSLAVCTFPMKYLGVNSTLCIHSFMNLLLKKYRHGQYYV